MSPSIEIQTRSGLDDASHSKSVETHIARTPDVAERVRRNVITEINLTDKYGCPDVYVNSKSDTLWYLWQSTIWVKPLRFEAKTGTYVIALKTDPAAELGKHRHRGPVTAYTVRGSWGYEEYNWTSTTGDYVVENPGTIHTLSMGENTEVIFTVGGSIEFFDSDGTLREVMDLFSFWRMYIEHCEANELPVNEKLWF
ncbi:hypothetical protein F5884DRAFT_319236 [Xylogone sp. PMI_703]|nr:hypothetical protein F5884DRAFT_319236 [Xylogone sp. PMI_703]